MAETKKETKMEDVKDSKKIDDHKNTEENKKAIAELEGESVPVKSKAEDKTVEAKEDKNEKKVTKKDSLKEAKPELEREYVIPLRREVLKTKRYRRAKRAVKTVKEFLARHMKVEDRDIRKVKVNIHLNNEIWFRGIKKPANKIKVKAKKIDGVVYAELAEVPEVVQYKISREIKRAALVKKASKTKVEAPKEEVPADADKDGVADSKEKKEKAKAVAEKEAKVEKAAAKTEKHTAKGAHAKKTMPQRKVLK